MTKEDSNFDNKRTRNDQTKFKSILRRSNRARADANKCRRYECTNDPPNITEIGIRRPNGSYKQYTEMLLTDFTAIGRHYFDIESIERIPLAVITSLVSRSLQLSCKLSCRILDNGMK